MVMRSRSVSRPRGTISCDRHAVLTASVFANSLEIPAGITTLSISVQIASEIGRWPTMNTLLMNAASQFRSNNPLLRYLDGELSPLRGLLSVRGELKNLVWARARCEHISSCRK